MFSDVSWHRLIDNNNIKKKKPSVKFLYLYKRKYCVGIILSKNLILSVLS